MSRVEGIVVVVTGACGLIGRKLAPALAEMGARVVVADLAHDACEALASRAPGMLAMPTDVTDQASLEALRDATLEAVGGLDAVVHAAALDDKVEVSAHAEMGSGLTKLSVADFRRTLDVNVTGTFLVAKVLGEAMAARRHGSIVNVASTYAVVAPVPGLYVDPHGVCVHHKSPAYVASKGAVLSFTRYLAAELGRFGVRANALTPGGVRASQPDWFADAYAARTPLGRMATPEDLVGAAAFLVSDASRYVTGTNLVVDGGYTAW